MPSAHVHRFPKIAHIVAMFCTAGLLAGCGSLERSELFATGRDARTYNLQTGRYEWPDDEPAQARGVSRRNDAAPKRKDTPPDDGRVFNPQKGRFESAGE